MRPDRLRWIVLLLVLLALPAAADWKRDYALGERAVRQSQWAEAERLFRQAAREEPTASERKRFEGVVFRDYAPYYWAGYAAWKQGACSRALEYWQDSANDPAVLAKIKDFKTQQDRGLAECRQQLAQATPATPPPAVASAPPQAPAAASTPPRPATPAVQTPVSQPTPRPAARPAASSAAAAPEALRKAVDAWLKGRYSELLRADPATLADARARAQLHLLRAAVRHAQAELSEQSASELSAAREELRAARRAQANITADAVLFPPRFRAFVQDSR